MTTAQEVQEQADALPPLVLRGRSLSLVCVSALGLSLSCVAIGLRVWCRAIWLSKVWGLDDTLACLGLVAYTVSCTYAILSACYGLGVPDIHLDPFYGYRARALEYNVWWEISYLICAALIKTSIGVAVVRIALERRYRYTIYAFIIFTNAACIGGVIWELVACRPISSRWNILEGECFTPGLIPISYAITVVTVITDAGFSLVPVLILRKSMMRPRVKYALMVVLAMGSLAAIASVGRFPFVPYFNATENYLYNNVWIPLLSEIECAVGIITGSLPGIGKMFNFFDPPKKSTRSLVPPAEFVTPGAVPSPPSECSVPEERHSAKGSLRRPSLTPGLGFPKITKQSVKGVWRVRTMPS